MIEFLIGGFVDYFPENVWIKIDVRYPSRARVNKPSVTHRFSRAKRQFQATVFASG